METAYLLYQLNPLLLESRPRLKDLSKAGQEARRMGKAFSALGRKATKPIREFNLEERAHRAITKENRPKAPRHASTIRIIEESVRNQPEEVKRKLIEKDTQLLERLKDVYVTSEDVTPEKKLHSETPERPLPSDRAFNIDPEYGFHEPVKIPYGKITLRTALDVISKHQQDPEVWSAKKISYEYKMDMGLTEKVLSHFRTFVLILPDPSQKHKITEDMLKASPLTAPIYLKQLPSGSEEESRKSEDKSNSKETSSKDS